MNIRLLLTVLLIPAFTGCTQEIRNYYNHEFKPSFSSYDSADTKDFFFDGMIKNNQEKELASNINLCSHRYAEDRQVTIDGVEGKTHYRYCPTTHMGPTEMQRLENHPENFKSDQLHPDALVRQ